MKSRRFSWRRALGWLIALAVLFFLAQALIRSWDQVTASGFEFRFDWLPLVVSLLLLVLARGLAAEAWRRVLWALGEPLAFRAAFYAWFVSNLVRYIPGNIWQVATLMVLVEREGVSRTNALLSQAIYTMIALSMAGLFGLWLLPIPREYGPYVGLLFVAVILVLAQPLVFRLMTAASRRVLAEMRSRLPRGAANGNGNSAGPARVPPRLTVWRGLLPPLASFGAWTCNGLAFYLFVRSLSPLTLEALPVFAAIYAAAYFIGYVSFITPSGLGFREGAMALLLAPYFPMPVAVAIAFAARLWATASELIGTGAAVLLAPRANGAPAPLAPFRGPVEHEVNPPQ